MNATTSSFAPAILEPDLLTAIRPLILRAEAERARLLDAHSVDGVLDEDADLQALLDELNVEIASAHFAVAKEGVL